MARPVIAALLVLLVGAACNRGETSPGPSGPGPTMVDQSLIEGVVVAGPVCPVQSVSPDPACEDRPVSGAVLVIEDARGGEVARVASDPDGKFRLRLPPGRYRLVAQDVEGLLGTPGPMDLAVEAGEAIDHLVIAYDTGIR